MMYLKKMLLTTIFVLFFGYNVTYSLSVENAGNNTPIVTFISDDNKSDFLSIEKPIFDKYKIKSTLAVITDTVGSEDSLTLEQLKQLQEEGFEVVSHSKTHSKNIFKASEYDLNSVSDENILEEYKESSEWLKSNGFKGFDVIVYPWGEFGNETYRYIELASKYYKYGINATPYNKDYNDMYINRLFLNKNNSIDKYKKAIDKIIENNGWLILGIHSNTEEMSSEYLEEIISYMQNKDIQILPFEEAVKLNNEYVYSEKYISKKKILLVGASILLFAVSLYLIQRKYKKHEISKQIML